ncbi:RHS repeat protein, partial [Escherichia coli]
MSGQPASRAAGTLWLDAAGDLTAVIAPDGSRNGTQYDAWGKAIRTTQGGLTRSMEYDA